MLVAAIFHHLTRSTKLPIAILTPSLARSHTSVHIGGSLKEIDSFKRICEHRRWKKDMLSGRCVVNNCTFMCKISKQYTNNRHTHTHSHTFWYPWLLFLLRWLIVFGSVSNLSCDILSCPAIKFCLWQRTWWWRILFLTKIQMNWKDFAHIHLYTDTFSCICVCFLYFFPYSCCVVDVVFRDNLKRLSANLKLLVVTRTQRNWTLCFFI